MKKRYVLTALVLLVLAAAGTGGIYRYITAQKQEDEKPPLPEGMEKTAGVVTAAGTTSTGLIEKELELDFLETALVVDEVYVSSSDTVEKGDKVLKITDSSLTEATRELERAKMDALLACRQGGIDYETGLLDAENTLKKSRITAEFAKTVYEDALAEAQAEVTKAQQEVTDAEETVAEYTDAIEHDYYATEYQVAEKKAAYDKNVALFFEKLEDYGYELDDDDDDDPNTYNIVKKGSQAGSGGGGGNESGGSTGSNDGEATVLSLLKSEYQENKEEYDQAVADCQAATEKAKAGIAQAQDTLQLAQLSLQEAQIKLEKEKVSAQADYDMSVMEGEKAQEAYKTEKKRLQEAQEALEDAREEADEQYALFMETLGDGYLYTESAGTVLMVRAVENTELPTDGILLAYSDADTICVTAAVDQSDIAQIEVGDTAAVAIEGQAPCTGVVTQINPVSTSESKASVSYSVILELEEDSGLSANMTASVYFGMTGEEYNKLAGADKGGKQ